MNPSSSLGARLDTIFHLVLQIQQQNAYPYVWDCCCDHGYLGIKILAENLCGKLVFVDQVPHIIEHLRDKLAPFSTGKHELIVADAGDLRFDPAHRHLVILAGVGGERTVQIVQAIQTRQPDIQIDYIFCPSNRPQALRAFLSKADFGLAFENIACENKRCYEIIYVQAGVASECLSPVSLECDLWDKNNPDHLRYCSVSHFQIPQKM